ncbi:LacI family DNA-binding transcriptional regulator [uncultured Vibrio sp.]|uniref:LacI family DNA-binding transcriptional regulator n=1 Tax=uncultured Vibrio sp. TaxID=114054 RepID=UPI0029C91677|nr:LacI family DNA-binding transcriptional regulator [uncultured Vibrio sp.]
MTTVRDLAQYVGLSIATVSRALNESDKVSPETLKIVENAAKELNYEKKLPIRKKTNLFGVIFPNISNPFFSELLEVIENEAFHHGRCILFFNSRHNLRQEKLYLKECENHDVDGVFLVPHCMDEDYLNSIKKFKFNTVLLTRTTSILPSVAVDHKEGGRLAARHLLSIGNTKIGYIGPIEENEEKLTGFTETLEGKNVQLDRINMFDTEIDADINSYVGKLIIGKNKVSVSAVFCVNDVFAQKVMEAFNLRGIRIPEDVVVVGFDNSLTAKVLNISSVSQPMREIAHVGFDEMLLQINNQKKQVKYIPQLLLPRLVIRGSSIQIIEDKK